MRILLFISIILLSLSPNAQVLRLEAVDNYIVRIDSVLTYVTSAPTGRDLLIDIEENGLSVFSTPISIDDGQTSTVTKVISDDQLTYLNTLEIKVTQIGLINPGLGLRVVIYLTKD